MSLCGRCWRALCCTSRVWRWWGTLRRAGCGSWRRCSIPWLSRSGPATLTESLWCRSGRCCVSTQPAVRRRHDRDVYDLATSTKQLAYDPADFWVVDHLVQRIDPATFVARKPGDYERALRRSHRGPDVLPFHLRLARSADGDRCDRACVVGGR